MEKTQSTKPSNFTLASQVLKNIVHIETKTSLVVCSVGDEYTDYPGANRLQCNADVKGTIKWNVKEQCLYANKAASEVLTPAEYNGKFPL